MIGEFGFIICIEGYNRNSQTWMLRLLFWRSSDSCPSFRRLWNSTTGNILSWNRCLSILIYTKYKNSRLSRELKSVITGKLSTASTECSCPGLKNSRIWSFSHSSKGWRVIYPPSKAPTPYSSSTVSARITMPSWDSKTCLRGSLKSTSGN